MTRSLTWAEVSGRIIGVIVAIILSITMAWEYLGRSSPEAADPLAVANCMAAYRGARTSSDSAIVGARHMVVSREQAANAPTCGALRRNGSLSRDSSK